MSSGTLSLEEKKIRKQERDKLFKETHPDYYKNYRKKYNQDNKERMKEFTRKWRAEHPDKVKAQTKRSRQKNHDYLIERTKEWRRNNPDKVKAQRTQYYQEHVEELKQKAREKAWGTGVVPMAKNKDCSSFLGVHVAERVLSKVFESVTRMPYGNSGYDFICPKGFKIDVKSSCIRIAKRDGVESWRFNIRKNQIADYFLCLAFNTRDDLEPQRIWLIPANKTNHREILNINCSVDSIENWSQYEQKDKFDKLMACCNTLKGGVMDDI